MYRALHLLIYFEFENLYNFCLQVNNKILELEEEEILQQILHCLESVINQRWLQKLKEVVL